MKKEFTKYIKSLDEKGLYQELEKLYRKIPDVAKYYDMELNSNSEKIVANYKKSLKAEYFPSRGYGKARSAASRKIVLDFKKISDNQVDLIDLWLYRTEMMIKYTMSYGDISEAFYNSLATGFEAACELIQQKQLEEHYLIYCKELIAPLADIGWGVYDDCYTDYKSYFGLD
jgi:hypothetical protein